MRFLKPIFAAIVFSSVLPTMAFAQTPNTLKLINHFSEAMDFKIGINPEVLPDLPKQFKLNVNEETQAVQVVELPKRAFVRGQDVTTGKKYAFWAVGIVDGNVKVSPYEASGIAFSIRNNVIIFCTPDEYRKHRSCFAS